MTTDNPTAPFSQIQPAAALGLSQPEPGTVRVPIEGNRNDKDTMFAGSVYSALVLAGWSLATETAMDLDGNFEVVIASSSTKFEAPVRSDAEAVATLDEGSPSHRPSGNWKMSITVALQDEGGLCAVLEGTYVAVTRG